MICFGVRGMNKEHEISTISLGELSGLIHGPIDLTLSRPFSRQIFLCGEFVAGCNHIEKIEKYIAKLKVGDRITLLREPKNPYDELAILVEDEKGHKLGYLPRARNHVMARLMDAGKLLYGVVTELRGPNDSESFPFDAIFVEVYMDD